MYYIIQKQILALLQTAWDRLLTGWTQGTYASASANFGSLPDVSSFSNAFLNNPYVGVRKENRLISNKFAGGLLMFMYDFVELFFQSTHQVLRFIF
jgi:hypothetical protein